MRSVTGVSVPSKKGKLKILQSCYKCWDFMVRDCVDFPIDCEDDVLDIGIEPVEISMCLRKLKNINTG